MNTKDRFNEKWETVGECWLWTRASGEKYGRFKLDGRQRLAHRVSYELHVGPIPEGLVIDHLCRTPRCVNPDHLEAVTQMENVARSPHRNAVKTHCVRGHKFSEENTYITKSGGRRCRRCHADRELRRYHDDRSS